MVLGALYPSVWSPEQSLATDASRTPGEPRGYMTQETPPCAVSRRQCTVGHLLVLVDDRGRQE